MDTRNITIAPLTEDDREQFILDNQEAFRFLALAVCLSVRGGKT